MAKFNELQKRKRAAKAERKRAIHGDPVTGKLKNRSQNFSISGKRKRKLLKKWRREQKNVIEKGLLTMEDVEMVAADASHVGTSKEATKAPKKFSVKKSLKLKKSKRKGTKNKDAKSAAEASADIMVE